MISPDQIHEHMEVIAADGVHVGTVDHMEGKDRLKLTKNDPAANGQHHYLPLDWVDHVDAHVHLKTKSQEVMSKWQTH
jgi:hypothetical protein